MNPIRAISIIITIAGLTACKPIPDKYCFDPRILNANGLTLSEIADDIIYIPLGNSITLGNLGYFKFINSSIYFYSNEGIIEYDRLSGELRKIGKIGRGPGEYLSYSNFCVSKASEEVYVLDQGDLVKTYAKSGQFLRSFQLQRNGSTASIDFIGSNLIVTYSIQFENGKYSWMVFDTLGSIIKMKFSGIPEFKSIYRNSYATYSLDDRVYYWNAYTDTVFSVLPSLTEDRSLILASGEHRFPRNNTVPINPFEKYMVINSIFETDRFIIINYYFRKPILFIHDKQDKKDYMIKLKFENNMPINGILNDLDGGLDLVPESAITENGREYLVGTIYPNEIKTQVSKDEFKKFNSKYPEKKLDLERLGTNLKETDNPVIVMIRLKK
jgi:hypothetical protein